MWRIYVDKDNEINKNNLHVITRSKAKFLQCYYREGNLIKAWRLCIVACAVCKPRKHQADFPYRGIRQGHTGCCTRNN